MSRAAYERELQEIKKKGYWREMQFFHGIQEDGIMALARLSRIWERHTNELIMKEGGEIKHVFIVGAGQVTIEKKVQTFSQGELVDEKIVPLTILGKGEL